MVNTMIHRKTTKFLVYWSSNNQKATPAMHFFGDLWRAKKIFTSFDEEVSYITHNF